MGAETNKIYFVCFGVKPYQKKISFDMTPQIRNYEVESQQILNFQWYGETLIGFR